jgi:hypothetical protein
MRFLTLAIFRAGYHPLWRAPSVSDERLMGVPVSGASYHATSSHTDDTDNLVLMGETMFVDSGSRAPRR